MISIEQYLNKLKLQLVIALCRIILICGLIFHWNACIFYIISLHSDTSKWPGMKNSFKVKNDDVSDVNVTFDDDDFWPWPYMPEKITDVHYAKDYKVIVIQLSIFLHHY